MKIQGWVRWALAVSTVGAIGGSVEGGGEVGTEGYRVPSHPLSSPIPWQPLHLSDRPSILDNLASAVVKTYGEYKTYNKEEEYSYVMFKGKYYSSFNPDCIISPIDSKKGLFYDYCSSSSGDGGFILNFPKLMRYPGQSRLIGEIGDLIYLVSAGNRHRSDSWFNYPDVYILDTKKNTLDKYTYFSPSKGFGYEDFCQPGYSSSKIVRKSEIVLSTSSCSIKLSIKLDSMAGKYFHDKK